MASYASVHLPWNVIAMLGSPFGLAAQHLEHIVVSSLVVGNAGHTSTLSCRVSYSYYYYYY